MARITPVAFDKSTVRDDNMIGGFEEVVTLYRLRRNYPFRDDASGFACYSVFATMQGARNFGHASKNALRNNPRELNDNNETTGKGIGQTKGLGLLLRDVVTAFDSRECMLFQTIRSTASQRIRSDIVIRTINSYRYCKIYIRIFSVNFSRSSFAWLRT